MVSKKFIVPLILIIVVIGVASLTWVGDTTPPEHPEPNYSSPNNSMVNYTSEDLPPGITTQRITASTITQNHASVMENSTYQLTRTITRTINGETHTEQITYQKGPNAVSTVQTADGELIRERYAYNNTLYERRSTNTRNEYTTKSGFTINPIQTELLTSLFVTGAWGPTNVTSTNAVQLNTDELVTDEYLSESFNVDNATRFNGVATVNARSHITKLNTSWEGDRNGDPISMTYTMTVTRINQTAVSQPSWVKQAQTSSDTSRTGISGDFRTIYVHNTGSDNIPAGSTVEILVDNGDTYSKVSDSLSQSVDSDSTVYLTIVDGSLESYVGETPSKQGDKLDAESYVIRVTPPGEDAPVLEAEIRPQR